MVGVYKIVVNIFNLVFFVLKEVIVDVVKVIIIMKVNVKLFVVNFVLRLFLFYNIFFIKSWVFFEVEYDGNMSVIFFIFNFGDGFERNGILYCIVEEYIYVLKGEFNVIFKIIY